MHGKLDICRRAVQNSALDRGFALDLAMGLAEAAAMAALDMVHTDSVSEDYLEGCEDKAPVAVRKAVVIAVADVAVAEEVVLL